MSLRSYQERISGERPDWKVSELAKIGELNEGQVLVDLDGVEYAVSISAGNIEQKTA